MFNGRKIAAMVVSALSPLLAPIAATQQRILAAMSKLDDKITALNNVTNQLAAELALETSAIGTAQGTLATIKAQLAAAIAAQGATSDATDVQLAALDGVIGSLNTSQQAIAGQISTLQGLGADQANPVPTPVVAPTAPAAASTTPGA